VFSLDFPWLGKCCVLSLLDLYIYFGFPLARLKWSILLKSVRLPLQSPRICPSPQPVTTNWNQLQPDIKDLDYAHIYEPAIHLMSTYIAHAVAWLVQNGLPSLSWGHSGAVMLGKISYTSTCQTQTQHASVDGPIEGQNAWVACPWSLGYNVWGMHSFTPSN
jgi:hypothetical protein